MTHAQVENALVLTLTAMAMCAILWATANWITDITF